MGVKHYFKRVRK